MSGEWRTVALGEIVERIAMGPFGSDIKTENFVTRGVPVLRGMNLNGYRLDLTNLVYLTAEKAASLGSANAFPEEIVVTHRGTLGQVGIIPHGPFDRYVVSQSQLRIACNKQLVDPHYIFYFLKSDVGQHRLLMNTSQTGVPALSRPVTSLKLLEVPLPPLPEQRRIAKILGDLDDKIELNRKMNETLEQMARALFKSWFVDFDPVRAKMEGRTPTGMDAATAALFPNRLVDSELGPIPEGWRINHLSDVSVINALTLAKSDVLQTIEYIEISEVNRGNIARIASYPRGEEPSRARRRLQHGDTVLSTVRPERGCYFLALHPPLNRLVSTGFAVVTPTKVPWSLLHAALTQPEISDHLGQLADGGAYPAVDTDVIRALELVLPVETTLIEEYHRQCASFYQLAEINRNQSRTLSTLRDTLLPKLVSGEVRVGVVAQTARSY